MKDRLQSSTSYPISILLVLASDHVTGATGLTPTVTVSKNGAAFGSPSGAVTEIGSGWYSLAANATDRNTLGELLVHATGTAADPFDDRYTIVPWNPFDANQGMTLATDVWAVAARTLTAASDTPGVTTLLARLTATRATNIDNLDTAVSGVAAGVWGIATRTLTAFGFTVNTNDSSGVTTLLTRVPGTVQPQTGDAYAIVNSGTFGNAQLVRSTTPANTLTVDSGHRVAEVALADTLTTYTGNTPQTGDAFARIGAAGAGLTALGDTRIANLDATISSRSTYAGGAVASVTAGVTVSTNNDKTGYALTAGEHTSIASDAQTGLTAQGYTTARAGFLDTLNGLVAAIWAAATRTLTAFSDSLGITTLLTRIPGTVQPQTGDSFARIGAAGAGLTNIGDARISNLDAAVSTRSTYSGGAVASVTAPVTAGTVTDKTGYALAVTPSVPGDAMALTSGERSTLTGVI